MKNVKKTLNKAFTLIELVVVMAVIAILAGVSVGVYFGVINNANQSAVDQEAAQARDAILLETSGLGHEGDVAGLGLSKAVMKNSTELELTFSSNVASSNDFGDSVDNALEAFYLLSLSEDNSVTLDDEISFNALFGTEYGLTGSAAEANGSYVYTVTGFQFQNGNGKTAEIHFGE